MKRIVRKRRLTEAQASRYRAIRRKIGNELPDLVSRHHERAVRLDQLEALVRQLKAERERRGLSLSDLTTLTGMDASALSKLETGQRPNPTVETLVRYAGAVGKRLLVSLVDS